MVHVEIVYVSPEKELVQISCALADGALVKDALEHSAIYQRYPETKELPLGIFSKRVSLNTPLKSGDRIEIYRELKHHPMEKRRLRFKNSLRSARGGCSGNKG